MAVPRIIDSFFWGSDAKTKYVPEKKEPRTLTEIRRQLTQSHAQQPTPGLNPAYSNKHYVHIRDFAFQPAVLNVEVGDTIVFHNDNQHLVGGAAQQQQQQQHDGHALGIHELNSSSPLLCRGERWEFKLSPEELALSLTSLLSTTILGRRHLTVRDAIFPFMAMTIFVKNLDHHLLENNTTKLNQEAAVGRSTGAGGSGGVDPNENKYADAFVYAAANVRKTLGVFSNCWVMIEDQ